jgi:hypothetical protein
VEEQIIEAVRPHVGLYDTIHSDYMKSKLKQDIWSAIAKDLNLSNGKFSEDFCRFDVRCNNISVSKSSSESDSELRMSSAIAYFARLLLKSAQSRSISRAAAPCSVLPCPASPMCARPKARFHHAVFPALRLPALPCPALRHQCAPGLSLLAFEVS